MPFSTPEIDEAQRWHERQVRDADFAAAHPELTASLHPTIAQAFRPLMFPAPKFTARVGKSPLFATSHEAVQYERGFNEFPNQPPGLEHGPRMQGYRDAEQARADHLANLAERRDFEVTQ